MVDLAAPSCRIAILGGGITGLTAAYTLGRARAAGAPVNEFLLEAGGRLGGLICTERVDGFTIEGGPDSFLTAKMDATGLCRELELEGELTGSNDAARQTYILRRGRLEPLPDGLALFVPARLGPAFRSRLIPWGSKLRILRDTLRCRPALSYAEDESVADFVRRHLGRGVLDWIADPLLTGVYGGDTETLSARALLPLFVSMEQRNGSLVRGMLKARKAPVPAKSIFTSLRGGLDQLPRALATKWESEWGLDRQRLWLHQRVEAIEAQTGEASRSPGASRYLIRCQGNQSYEAEAIIMALPAPECARLVAPFDSGLSHELAAIAYAPAVTVALGYKSRPPGLPSGFGFLVPRREDRNLLACTFVHTKFPARAPEGAALLRCFLGGAHAASVVKWSDEDLLSMVLGEIRDILGIAKAPDLYRVSRWPGAMPQYLVGHQQRVAEIERGIRLHPGLFLAGNATHGVGIPDCMMSARSAAEEACEFAAQSCRARDSSRSLP